MSLNQVILSKAEQGRVLADQRANRLIGATLHLFTNNVTVDRDTVLGDFTEAAWTGYAAQTLTTWTAAAELGDGIHVFSQNTDSPTFLNTSGSNQTFFGYYLLDGSGNLIGAAQSGSVTIPDSAAEIVVVQILQRSEFTTSP